MGMTMLFESLPEFPPALPDADLSLMASLPKWPTEREVNEDDHPAARRLERQGLIKISRQKMDPCADRPTWFAGRTPAATLRCC